MRIAKEDKAAEPEFALRQHNGDFPEASETSTLVGEATEGSSAHAEVSTEEGAPTEADGEIQKKRGIPNNVKLFEIFNEQVQTLVKMQRLPIQDTIGLLVSLANLAL